MFKKLTSFLFKEEEVLIEEEEIVIEPKVKEKPRIEKVEPFVAPKKKVEAVKEETPKEYVVEDIKTNDEKPKKRLMIDLDDEPAQSTFKKEEIKPYYETQNNAPYKPKEVISPMHGGDNLPETPASEKPVAKSRQPLTKIISPMYGAINIQDEEVEKASEEIYDMELSEIIQNEPKGEEEVQASLFDFLEEMDADES